MIALLTASLVVSTHLTIQRSFSIPELPQGGAMVQALKPRTVKLKASDQGTAASFSGVTISSANNFIGFRIPGTTAYKPSITVSSTGTDPVQFEFVALKGDATKIVVTDDAGTHNIPVTVSAPVLTISGDGATFTVAPNVTKVLTANLNGEKVNAKWSSDTENLIDGQGNFEASTPGPYTATAIYTPDFGITQENWPNFDDVQKAMTLKSSVTVNVMAGFLVDSIVPLRVRLNLMDDSTVDDLFGHNTNQLYYCVQASFQNMIKDSTKSMLLFSSSIETKVALEKRFQARLGSENIAPQPKGWTQVTNQDVAETVTDVAQCGSWQSPYAFTYRPYTETVMVSSSDKRLQREPREMLFRYFAVASAIYSSANAVGLFKDGMQTSNTRILDQTTNILVPALRELYPSLAEVQRQNLNRLAMKEVETIAPGGTLDRVIFFPKGSFKGVKRGFEFRISEIDQTYLTVRAALIEPLPSKDTDARQTP